jgi:RHS repeat-associated protein
MRVMTSTNTTVFPSEQTAFDSLGRMTLRTLGGVGYSVSYGDNAHKDAPTGYLTNSYSYDAAGSQITRTVGGATQSRNFDAENRLAQISAGGVVSAYIYDANGQRLIKSVSTGDTTQRTLYIGSLYEEDLSSKEPPYINYYQLGGKLVGMRRANQAASNGQYRLVSEQLGSTTLVVDTSTPSQVVQRQYHKPYGEVAWQYQASGSLTSINFTGQRLDSDSGLLYYGARFYDPVLSHFLSADTIIPDEVNPQALNRYSYVLNNPLKNVDPTGHCKEDASDIDQLDCTADDFDAMTADERIQWVKKFMELGRYGDVFKSIVGIIEYFRDSGIIDFTPGKSWTSLADAAILAAIQDGQRLSQGRTGLLTDPKARSAATKWSTFLKYYQQHDRDLDETSRELFNAAELAGEDFGTSYADKNRTHPVGLEGAVIDTFTQGGNVYRNANIYGVAAPSGFIGAGAVGAAGAYALTDPRCENCVYYGAFAIQAAVVLGWTVCVVCR